MREHSAPYVVSMQNTPLGPLFDIYSVDENGRMVRLTEEQEGEIPGKVRQSLYNTIGEKFSRLERNGAMAIFEEDLKKNRNYTGRNQNA